MEICPVKPTSTLRPSAAMPNTPIWMRRLNQYSLSSSGAKQMATTPAIAKLRLALVGKIVVSAA